MSFQRRYTRRREKKKKNQFRLVGRNQKNFGLWSLITKADLVRKHPAERPVSSGPYYVHITYTPCCVYVHRTRYLLNSFSFSNAICCVRESRDSNSCVSCSLKIFEIKAVIWRNRIYDVSKKGNKGPPKFGFWECQKIIVKKKKKKWILPIVTHVRKW